MDVLVDPPGIRRKLSLLKEALAKGGVELMFSLYEVVRIKFRTHELVAGNSSSGCLRCYLCVRLLLAR